MGKGEKNDEWVGFLLLFIFIWSGGYPTKIIKPVARLKPQKKKKNICIRP